MIGHQDDLHQQQKPFLLFIISQLKNKQIVQIQCLNSNYQYAFHLFHFEFYLSISSSLTFLELFEHHPVVYFKPLSEALELRRNCNITPRFIII